MTEIRRRGRPVKYQTDLERIETRRLQNRINQRRFKRKRKLQTELNQLSIGEKFDTQYREEIRKYFNQFNYDYFFTGTFDERTGDKEYFKNILVRLDLVDQYNEWLSKSFRPKTIGINGIRDYVDRYLDFLSSKNSFERCFFVIEKGKKSRYHVHMMFKSKEETKDFDWLTENSWLIGCSICLPVKVEIDMSKMVEYCLKEFKPSSKIKSDQNIVDSWNFRGDFERKEYEHLLKLISPNPVETSTESVHC